MEGKPRAPGDKYVADISSIKAAHDRIISYVHRTPVLSSETLNSLSGRELYFKCECFQKGGAFKFRGACNDVYSLTDDEEARTLLGRYEYQKGNIEAALHVFKWIDIAVVTPKMKITLALKGETHKRHSQNYATPPMSIHAIHDASFKEESKQISETLKKVKAKASLIRVGSISLAELSKLKAYILDSDSEVIWNILVEVTINLQHCDESIRRQWLSDTAEVLCMTSHPSTVRANILISSFDYRFKTYFLNSLDSLACLFINPTCVHLHE